MLIGPDRTAGTIGGGRLEFEAIAAARTLIESGATQRTLALPLGPAIGQCCGGHVTVQLERATRTTLAASLHRENEELAARPLLFLFGAGHVGKAIATAMAPLPLRLVWVDSRSEEFPADIPGNVERLLTADPLTELEAAPAGAGAIILTHSHALDFALAEAALSRGDLAYVGLIGSSTKRTKFQRLYMSHGGKPADLAQLVCPIGAGLSRDKRPAVIAAMVAAEVLVAMDGARTSMKQPAAPCDASCLDPAVLRCTRAGIHC
jgi:xanthine dehydrogenase accessory protein XdhC